MLRVLTFTAAALGLMLLCAQDADAQKKDKKGKDAVAKATPEEYKQIRNTKELVGTLAYADMNNRMITLRIDIPHMEPNPNYKPGAGAKGGGNNQMQNIYRQQAEVMRIQNPIQRQQRMMQLMQQMQKQQYQQMMQAGKGNNGGNNGAFRLVNDSKEYDLDVSEKATFRKLFLPRDFDDKGFLKEYTKEEIAKLKGKDTSKPGYESKFDELVNGQKVKLFLAPPKKDEAAGAEGAANVSRPTIIGVHILEDSTQPLFNPQAKKKAK